MSTLLYTQSYISDISGSSRLMKMLIKAADLNVRTLKLTIFIISTTCAVICIYTYIYTQQFIY